MRMKASYQCTAALLWLVALLSRGVSGMHDGRLCCRFRNKKHHPTAAVFIPELDIVFTADFNGVVQMVNRTNSPCGTDNSLAGETARWVPSLGHKPWGAMNFQGATIKTGDKHIVYLLVGGRSDTNEVPRVYFADIDAMELIHNVTLPSFPVSAQDGAGSLTWIPDGSAEGRFLVGSHVDGLVHPYRISSDRSLTSATLLGEPFRLAGTDPTLDIMMSGMTYEPVDGVLFTLFHKGSWKVYKHNVTADGIVTDYIASRAALANRVGGSPPFKHEGLAAVKHGNVVQLWIADKHRYVYNVRWRDRGRWVACPWVFRRIIGCCHKDAAGCENLEERICKKKRGKVASGRPGRGCTNKDTCVNALGIPSMEGCPVGWMPQASDGECYRCRDVGKGGMKGCDECQGVSGALTCTKCLTGFYLHSGKCFECNKPATDAPVPVDPLCTQCSLDSANANQLTCTACDGGTIDSDGLCVACDIQNRGTPHCNACTRNTADTSLACTGCTSGYHLTSQGSCAPCTGQVANCAQCHSSPNGASVQCDVCEDGFVLSTTNTCLRQCPSGFYATYINRGQEKGPAPIRVCHRCEANNLNAQCFRLTWANSNEAKGVPAAGRAEPVAVSDGGHDDDSVADQPTSPPPSTQTATNVASPRTCLCNYLILSGVGLVVFLLEILCLTQ